MGTSGAMVTLPSGNEAVYFGWDGSDTGIIFKLTWEGDELQWVMMPHKHINSNRKANRHLQPKNVFT